MMINAADTVWILISAALVLLMTPGVAFFYGGMVRRKNILSTMMMSFTCLGLVGVFWIFFGYTLSFGPSAGGVIGNLKYIALLNVGTEPSATYATTVPQLAFMVYQGMFAVITVALITGAVVERMRFAAVIVFSVLWALLVYSPICHWIWGSGGWLASLGVLDFAGGAVVHINAGVSALALVLLLGHRRGFPREAMEPNSIPLVVLGAGLLWFGWFGFNGGSALAANGVAVTAFVNTNIAGAAAALAWMFLGWRQNRPTILGTATGAVAGLATVTPAAGFVTPVSAFIIGVAASLVCYYSMIFFKSKLKFDDSLDVFAVHGVGGILGMLAVGLFASVDVNAAGADGLFAGNAMQLLRQLLGVAVVAGYAFIATWIIGKVLSITMRIRVKQAEESVGLDLSQHGERAYGGFVR